MKNKYNIIFVIITVLGFNTFLQLSSCQPIDSNARIENTDGTYELIEDKTKHDFNIIHHYIGTINDSNYNMTEIEHDGCRYLILEGYGETLSFKHKENCMNSYH